MFKSQFRAATRELFNMLSELPHERVSLPRATRVSFEDLAETHLSTSRVYDSQVVEIRDDLSLIILMSTADEVNILCKPSSHSLTSHLYLPVYIFEVRK
jgi:hypothetical protein